MYINFIYQPPPLFEYDPKKSASNLEKHGIDFEHAKRIWEDENRVTLEVQLTPEIRYVTIGKIGSKHWTAVHTRRADNIRLISVRRSRKQEVNYYEAYH